MRKLFYMLTCGIAISLAVTSCETVKEYQKAKVNDADIQLSGRKDQRFEQNFQSYREGASGANGGKTGGGCGCN